MKTLYQFWNSVYYIRPILPVLVFIVMGCNQQQEKDLPPNNILKAKPIHIIPEENTKSNESKVIPPDTITLPQDSLQLMKDTTETMMDQAPKKPATIPKKYFKLNIHKRPMITRLYTPLKKEDSLV